jgi:hypothetical protein
LDATTTTTQTPRTTVARRRDRGQYERETINAILAREVTDEQEKRSAFDALVNHVVPGRSADVRAADAQELKATSVLCLVIEEASAKVRRGPPIDAEEDYALNCWAGVLPMQLVPGHPVDDPRLEFGTPVPAGVAAYRRQRSPSDID